MRNNQHRSTDENAPQWFAVHYRHPVPYLQGEMFGVGRIVRCASMDFERVWGASPHCVAWHPCGDDLDAALRHAVAVDERGGWERGGVPPVPGVDILEVVVDFIHESKALRLMGRAEKNDGAIRLPLTAVADLGALAAAGIPYALHPAKGPSMGIEEDDAPTMSM